MKPICCLLMSILVFVSCHKDDIPDTTAMGYDKQKLVEKNWFWGGKQTPQLLQINFKSNDTAVLTQCTWVVTPYRYATYKYQWHQLGKDSIDLNGFHFKIHSLTDSLMVTSNWVVGGVSDTIRQTFKTY